MEKLNQEFSVAAIMERHNIDEDISFFTCSNVVKGYYDEKRGVFTDVNNNEYTTMDDVKLLNSAHRYAYNNVLGTEELRQMVGNNSMSLDKCIEIYKNICKDEIWIAGLISETESYIASVNISNLESQYKELKEKVKVNPFISTKEKATIKEDKSTKTIPQSKQLEELKFMVMENKLSKEELIKLSDDLQNKIDDIDSLLESVNISLESKGVRVNTRVEDLINSARSTKSANDLAREFADDEPDPFQEYEKRREIKRKENLPIDIGKVFKEVTKTLVAQDEPTRRVIAEIARKTMNDRKKREGILLTGDTGVGKTLMMELIAKNIDRPFYEIDSTQITVPGYVGKNIEEYLWDLYETCGRSVSKAENAIIYFDEIDKKGSPKKDDVSGKGVLNLLLKFIEGSSYDASKSLRDSGQKVTIKTSNMIVILGGAFTDVYSQLGIKNTAGFTGNVSTEKKERPATVDDFVKYAMMPEEFMGRVNIVRMNSLDVESLKRILNESDKSALRIQQEIFEKLGVKLTATDSFVTKLAEEAEKKKTGARGINGIIDQATWMAFEDAYTHPEEYSEIIINEESLEDPSIYQKVYKKGNNNK